LILVALLGYGIVNALIPNCLHNPWVAVKAKCIKVISHVAPAMYKTNSSLTGTRPVYAPTKEFAAARNRGTVGK